MSYWELEPEAWELLPDDNYDGARWMECRGRKQSLEKLFTLDCNERD